MKNSIISTATTLQSISGKSINSKSAIKEVLTQVFYLIASIFISRGTVFDTYSPFGPSLVAAVNYNSMWAVISGSIIGYMMPSSINGSMRYISTTLAIAAVRWTLSDLSKIQSAKVYAPIIAFAPTFATGLAMNTVDGITLSAITMSIVESTLCATATFFFSNSFNIFINKKSISSLSQIEFTCVFITCCIATLSFSKLYIGFFSVGRVVAAIAVLLCSTFAGVSAGAISGTCSGVVLSLSSPSLSYLAGSYAFSGMMSGFFSKFGKATISTTFLVSSAIMSLQTSDPSIVVTGVYEVVLSTIIFMLLPRKILNIVANIFYLPKDSSKTEGLRRSVIIRLNFIGKSLCSVADSVDSVSQKLEKLYVQDSSLIYKKVAENVCDRCGMKTFCWKKEKNATTKVFSDINSKLLQDHLIKSDQFPEEFIRRCCKIGEVTAVLNKSYDEFQMNETSRRRVNEIRCVVADQFAGMGEILSNVAKEFDTYEHFDLDTSKKINEALKFKKLVPIDSVCRIDKFGRMCVEIETAYADKKVIDDIKISKLLYNITGRDFDSPSIITAPDRCRIQISEKPVYTVNVGSAQHICNNGTLCGDSYSYFNDGAGRMIIILSDGMGTGGRAAVDGAMASDIMSRLSKSGLNFESALKIVNSALFIKSSDESLATIDVVCIDLFTGEVDLIKAGAPLTLVKTKNKVVRFDTSSLPAGILMDLNFAHEQTKIGSEDLILMMSDGALSMGEEFLEEKLMQWKGDDPQEFASYLVAQLIQNRSDGYDDDITVVAIRPCKS